MEETGYMEEIRTYHFNLAATDVIPVDEPLHFGPPFGCQNADELLLAFEDADVGRALFKRRPLDTWQASQSSSLTSA